MHNDINFLDAYVLKRMQANPNRSLSAMFRNLRMKVPLIGDYPVMMHIIRVCKANGYKFTKNQLYQACRSSRDYKEDPQKSNWLVVFQNVFEGV